MLKTAARRLLISIPLVIIVTLITFVLQSLIPGDAARVILGQTGDPTRYDALREQLNLDVPFVQRYGDYLLGMLRGDLGTSIYSQQSVTEALLTRLPVTLTVILLCILVVAVVGIVLGVLSATGGPVLRKVVDVLSLVGMAVPDFWFALLLISTFAVSIPIFPAIGFVPFGDSPSRWALSLVLPVAALALAGTSSVAKMTRDGLSTVMEKEFIRTLRASGVSNRSLVWKHGLKNAGVQITTVVGLCFVGALSGSIFVEQVFSLPGLGKLVIDATNTHDLPLVQGVALTFTLIVIAVNLVVDLTYTLLNPKVRTS